MNVPHDIANGVMLNAYPEPPAALEHGMSLAKQAVALDESLPVGHFVLGLLHIMLQRDFQQGIAEAERAVAVGPASADAYTHLATFLTWADRPEDALPVCEKASRLAPIPS